MGKKMPLTVPEVHSPHTGLNTVHIGSLLKWPSYAS